MIKSVALTIAVRLLMVVAALVSSIVTARLLGPEGRGLFFYWSMVAGIAMQLGNLGLHSSNTYYLSKDQTLWGPLAANALLCAIGVGCLTMLVLMGLEAAKGTLATSWPNVWPTALLAATGLYFLLGTNLLIAQSRFTEFNLLEICNRYLAVALIAAAAWHWQTSSAALMAAAAASLLICVPLYLRIRSLGGTILCPDLPLFRRGFGYASRAYLISLLGFFVLRVNVFVLERYTGSAELGTWSIAAQILDIINILPGAVGLVLFPTILRSSTPYATMLRSLAFVGGALAVMVIGVTTLGQGFITLLYGHDFAASYYVLLWGLPGSVALGLLTVASQFLATAGIPRRLIAIWAAGLAIEILAAFLLVPTLGAEGGMMAFSIAHIAVLALVWWLVQAQRRREHEFRSTGATAAPTSQ